MVKYLTVFNIAWENGLVYRMSLFIWRFRQFLSTIMAFTVWTVIFSGENTAFGYTATTMTSYIFLVSVLQSLILASSLHGLSGEIYSGNITPHLLKPINVFYFLGSLDMADKMRNVVFSIVEAVILFFIFKPELLFPSWQIFSLFVIWSLLGTLLHFFITLWFGSMGFWSPNTWGPKFLFFMVLDFTAGKLYPLDILPPLVQKAIWLTPFPYLSYAQIQLFLGRLSLEQTFWQTLGLLFWTGVIGWITVKIWNKGLRSYEATGQ